MASLKTAFIATSALLVSLIVGGIVGFNVATNTCKHLMNPLLVSTGDQARNTLVLLEQGRINEYTGFLEAEVTRSLEILDHLEALGEIPKGSPMLHVQRRLRDYRKTHPVDGAPATVDTKEE
jgi:hypothetical protein